MSYSSATRRASHGSSPRGNRTQLLKNQYFTHNPFDSGILHRKSVLSSRKQRFQERGYPNDC